MFRSDILWLLPAVIVAGYELFIWGKLPQNNSAETEIQGEYDLLDRYKLGYLINFCYLIFWLQLVFPVFALTQNATILLFLRISGYILIIFAALIAITALRQLGKNWSGMDEYQIKKNHQLITTGIYSLTRHPIYLAVFLEVLGFELVANSWLLIPLIMGVFWVFNSHIAKEEKLLTQKFGTEYQNYKSHTKALIPFVY